MAEAGSIFIEYRVRWKTGGIRPGAFRGMHSGAGERFRSSIPLHARADPRRLDVRTSLRDPLGGIWVRDFEQNSALKVIVLADMSASMSYRGEFDKIEQLRRVAVAVARSAWRNGDAFGFYGANEIPQPALSLPARLNRGAAEWIARSLKSGRARGKSARGLLQTAAQLPQRRSLVFVVSDFHWANNDLIELLHSLSHHAVVPVVLWDPAESEAIPRRGIAVLRDLESGAKRFVWLRAGLVRALRKQREQREFALRRTCANAGCTPFFVRGEFAPLDLTRYFLETPA